MSKNPKRKKKRKLKRELQAEQMSGSYPLGLPAIRFQKRKWTTFIDVTERAGSPITRAMGLSAKQAMIVATGSPDAKMYENSHYRVIVSSTGALTHLSIRTLENEAIHDWRHFQRIKNELVGPECEAVELYPAESRLVDTSNQFHLWVFPKGYKIPWGFDRREVMEGDGHGTRQRPFEYDARPADVRAATLDALVNCARDSLEQFDAEKRRDEGADREGDGGADRDRGAGDGGVPGRGVPHVEVLQQGQQQQEGEGAHAVSEAARLPGDAVPQDREEGRQGDSGGRREGREEGGQEGGQVG